MDATQTLYNQLLEHVKSHDDYHISKLARLYSKNPDCLDQLKNLYEKYPQLIIDDREKICLAIDESVDYANLKWCLDTFNDDGLITKVFVDTFSSNVQRDKPNMRTWLWQNYGTKINVAAVCNAIYDGNDDYNYRKLFNVDSSATQKAIYNNIDVSKLYGKVASMVAYVISTTP